MSNTGKHRISTFQIIAFGFLALILLGALLLALPFASRAGVPTPFGDCLFTATSAVCVTGLVVRDTATHWSGFGQAVLLLLIQIGGLGVVTAAVSLAFVTGRKIGLMQRSVMQEAISAPQVGGIVRLTRWIIACTLAMELAGAALLAPVFIPELGVGRGLWFSIFHAVSAFCNAGFDLMGERGFFSSLTAYPQQPLLNITLMLLITVGGIGFLVWRDVREHGLRLRRYRLQSKLVLLTSLLLVLIPFVWFLCCELDQLSPGQRVLPALFQSVTLRTAGFNTVDLNAMSDSGKLLMILWMLIGGSPGSTAGGMKTTTVATLLLTAWAVFRRRESVTCFGRRIDAEAQRHAMAILVMYLGLCLLCGIAISKLEGLPVLTCLFETASAVGTVGLTLGVTSGLGWVSRGILMALMFLGRVGGLTLIYAAQASPSTVRSALPLEKITVG